MKSKNLFLLLIFIQLLLYSLSTYVLLEDSLFLDFFGEKLPYDRILQIIEDSKKWRWISLFLIPVYTLLKCFIVSCCLYMGIFFIKSNISLNTLFKIVTIAEFTTVLPIVVKIVWFGFVQRDYSIEDLNYFAPFSAINYFDKAEMDVWLIYPLQIMNIFELLYWVILSMQLRKPLNINFTRSIGFVASTYGAGLFLWILFVMFLIVSIS